MRKAYNPQGKERISCANIKCENKLRKYVGTSYLNSKFCATCVRKKREAREGQIEGPKIGYLGDEFLNNKSDDVFDAVWDSITKGKFQGYSRNTISGRAERQGKARAWAQSRKVKRGRTRKRYARNKKRGNVRPKMRRQLGAGGSRKETKR